MFTYLVMFDSENSDTMVMALFESETAAIRYAKNAQADTDGTIWVDRRYLQLSTPEIPISNQNCVGNCATCEGAK